MAFMLFIIVKQISFKESQSTDDLYTPFIHHSLSDTGCLALVIQGHKKTPTFFTYIVYL